MLPAISNQCQHLLTIHTPPYLHHSSPPLRNTLHQYIPLHNGQTINFTSAQPTSRRIKPYRHQLTIHKPSSPILTSNISPNQNRHLPTCPCAPHHICINSPVRALQLHTVPHLHYPAQTLRTETPFHNPTSITIPSGSHRP